MSDPVAVYYNQLADRYGDDPRAVDAPDQQALDVRYRVLGDLTDMNGKTVLEVGCGHGGLGAYLSARYPEIGYQGIDVSAGLLAVGHKAHPELDLHEADLFALPNRRFDVVVAQGIFYLLNTHRHAFNVIRRMYELTDQAAGFTAISSWRDEEFARELRLDPSQTLEFCRRLTPSFVLRHDYRLGDLAVYLYRKDA